MHLDNLLMIKLYNFYYLAGQPLDHKWLRIQLENNKHKVFNLISYYKKILVHLLFIIKYIFKYLFLY